MSKSKDAVDKVLHPKHDEDEAKKSKEPGEKASTQALVQSKPNSRRERANPAEDFKAHPKFAKFNKGT